jgi:hypothetical protein
MPRSGAKKSVSDSVLVDAQFSVARIFRPFEGFEAIYSGQTVRRPIAIPGNLDPDARQTTGFDPNLIAGIPVPMGSKIMLWIPTIFMETGEDDFQIVPYRYQFAFRLRNIRDFRERRGRSAYHFPRQSTGANSQFVVPAAQKIVVFEGPNVTLNTSPVGGTFGVNADETFATHQALLERLVFPSATPMAPLSPAGGGALGSYQQGVADFGTGAVNINQTVTFNSFQLDSEGDELMIFVDKEDNQTQNDIWNFSDPNGTDFGFSQFFGTGTGAVIRDLGIYVFTGSNP